VKSPERIRQADRDQSGKEPRERQKESQSPASCLIAHRILTTQHKTDSVERNLNDSSSIDMNSPLGIELSIVDGVGREPI
jgi:hypothetical protein